MRGKKAKELRRKAYNTWVTMKEEYKKNFTPKQVYKQMKKDLKRGK